MTDGSEPRRQDLCPGLTEPSFPACVLAFMHMWH